MNRSSSLQPTGLAVWWGITTLLLFLAPTTAFAAGEGVCEDPSGSGAYDWMVMTPDGWTPATPHRSHCTSPGLRPSNSADSHCGQNYSSMPESSKHLARQHAQEVLFSVLRGVYATRGGVEYSGEVFSVDSAADGTSMAWLEEMATNLAMASTAFERRAMCIPRVEGEQCESAPPRAVVVSSGSSSPADRLSVEFDVPWRPGDNELMQPALVTLRVGPSDEHRRLPERPPPA